MIQVTAIYQDSEVGYGEGESLNYAIDDCIESIPSIFEGVKITLSILENDVIRQVKNWPIF
jgi:hypothetical protein